MGGLLSIGVAIVCFAAALLLQVRPSDAQQDTAFQGFVENLWADAKAQPYNVSRATFDRAFRGVAPDLTLPDLQIPGRPAPKSSGQAEFIRPPQDYLNRKQLAGLADTGRNLARQHAATLARIEKEIGVEGPVVIAIWGRETSYGNYKLPHYAIRVLATQAYVGRRKEMFRTELLYALKMLEDRVVTPEMMKASWAGAMGLTQFMPSEFYQSLKSLDGARPDLFNSVSDALASAATQLAQKGWVTGLRWGFEVKIPPSADCGFEGPLQSRSLADWVRLGFARADGKVFSATELKAEAYLMSPGGANGPAFLVTENYKVIRRYNMSDLYATFVGNLADRIEGGGDFRTPWRAGTTQLSEIQVADIQRRLKARGYDIEKFDGKVGSNTRMQIGSYQRASRQPVDCWPSEALAKSLAGAAVAP